MKKTFNFENYKCFSYKKKFFSKEMITKEISFYSYYYQRELK